MGGIETLLVTTFERHMAGDEHAILEDADRIGQDMDVENAPARRVGHAVQILALSREFSEDVRRMNSTDTNTTEAFDYTPAQSCFRRETDRGGAGPLN